MQLSGLKSPPYFEERSESIEPGSKSRHAALGMYLPSTQTKKNSVFIKEFFNFDSILTTVCVYLETRFVCD